MHAQAVGEGIVPDLAELVALGRRVRASSPARRAWRGAVPAATSPLRGRGMEYAESRPYLPGDDARHIDWRVTARSGVAHSKLFHPERERTTLLVCDTAPGLFFGTRCRFKSVQAARALALATWAARRSGDRIAAVCGNEAEAMLPPAGGERGALAALHALCRWYAAPSEQPPRLDRALRRAARVLRPGARMVLAADPASVDRLPRGMLATIAQHVDVLCVLLADPIELSPPALRLPLLIGGQRHLVDFASPESRQSWDSRYAHRIARLNATLGRQRVGCLLLQTGESGDRLLPWLLSTRPEAA